MCIKTILDTSLYSRFASDEMKDWRKWVNKGDGIIVYTKSGQFWKELKNNEKILAFYTEQRRISAQVVSEDSLNAASKKLKDLQLQFHSNDQHVLELAFASEVRVLCTADQDLKSDFLKVLPSVSRKKRAIYPHDSKHKIRNFLNRRKCGVG